MNKFILKGRNGNPDRVGVIIIDDGGGRWSTSKYFYGYDNTQLVEEKTKMVFDPKIIKMLRRRSKCDDYKNQKKIEAINEEIKKYCDKTYNDDFDIWDDIANMRVKYVPVGSKFRIEDEACERNQGEYIVMHDEDLWMVA